MDFTVEYRRRAIKVSLINRCGYQNRIIGYPAELHCVNANAFQKLIYVAVHFKSGQLVTVSFYR